MPNTVVESQRELPVTHQADVVVCGGGPGGFVAAVAAGRNGARTLLIERYGFLGGMATAGLMASFNGFRNERPPNDLQTVQGLAQEVVDRLIDMGGATGRTAHGDFSAELCKGHAPYAVGFDPEALKRVAQEMCLEAGVELLVHSWACRALPRDEGGWCACYESKCGRGAAAGRIVVDATADGDIAVSAGAPYMQAKPEGERMMPMTLMFRLAGLEPERFEGRVGGVLHGKTGVFWGPGIGGVDGTDPRDLTRAEVETRQHLWQQVEEMKQRPGFENAYLVETATMIGVRETRRIRGEYVITEQDAIEGRRFDDVIAISSNPVPGYYGKRFFFEHEGFDVPYRSLVPLVVEDMLLAGRCISAEQVPFQSARSMAPNMAISQASGTAAALCVEHAVRPRKLDVSLLQKRLLAQGAELRKG